MKKLVSIIILCLGCLGILGAQNVWKPISSNSPILGAASNGAATARFSVQLPTVTFMPWVATAASCVRKMRAKLGKLYWAMKLVSVVTSTSIALQLVLKEEFVSLMITSRL